MVYVPFARKYRPRRFGEVVGQEIATAILKNAVSLGRVHHAYLFAGPRGVGKTTVARILAKALNCKDPRGGEPCGECENCREIDRGSFPDLVEMDAASNRGIDDIRAVKEAVSYTPLKGKYKVYIIDEAHMLTKEAFNALLKTLEEPPPKTVFVLCTTEYEKIIPTILSRCQRIIFLRVREKEIREYLKDICSREGIEFEEEALRAIAKASDGCLRDAASLLDQASVLGDGKVSVDVVEKLAGMPGFQKLRDFLKLLLASRVDEAIKTLRELYEKGYNLTRFWELLEEEVRKAILVKSLQDAGGVVEDPESYEEFKTYPLEALLYLENVINRGKVEARTRPPLAAYELAVVKTAIIKDILPISKALSRETGGPDAFDIEKRLEELLSPVAYKALSRARRFWEGDRLVFSLDEDTYRAVEGELEALKVKLPQVRFEVIKKKESQKNTRSLF